MADVLMPAAVEAPLMVPSCDLVTDNAAIQVVTDIATALKDVTTSKITVVPTTSIVQHARNVSSISTSDLSCLSSDLSSVDSSDDEDAVARKKRRRRGSTTPPGSQDGERAQKCVKARAAPAKRQRSTRSRQTEEDVPDRKLYLVAGLYSGGQTSVADRSAPRRSSVAISKRGSGRSMNDIAASFVFGLPQSHGLRRIEEDREFALPWDINNDFNLSFLPDTVDGIKFRSDALDRLGADMQHPPYQYLKQNRYTERRRDEAELHAICMCTSGSCGDSCLNRMMQYFCSSKLCPLGNKCTNLPFNERNVRHDLEVFWTGNRGFGLRTNEPIVAGEFVMEYRGEIISINESYSRVQNQYKDRHDYYFLNYFGAEVVDAGLQGTESRFINHSCNPNCQVVRWKLADFDEYQIGMFALRDIDAKEELCYDYGWQAFSSIEAKNVLASSTNSMAAAPPEKEKPQRCLCASEDCTGFLEKKEGAKVVAKRAPAGKRKGRAGKKQQVLEFSDSDLSELSDVSD